MSYEKKNYISKIPISIPIVLKFNRNQSEHAKNREKRRFWQKNPPFWVNFAEIFGIDKNPTNALFFNILVQLDQLYSLFSHIWPFYFLISLLYF